PPGATGRAVRFAMRFLPSFGRRRKPPENAVALGRLGNTGPIELEQIPAAPPLEDEAPDEVAADAEAGELDEAAGVSATAAEAPAPDDDEFDPRATSELPDFCADEHLIQRRHRTLADRWRWYDTPAERARLAAEYPHLCPDLESPWEWY